MRGTADREALWAFDVDGCLIDSLTGSSLRPGAHDLLTRLQASGSFVVVWSAGGADYARRRSEQHGIAHLVDAFHGKDRRGADGRFVADFVDWTARGGAPAIFVDDRPEDPPSCASIVGVSPYLTANPHDRGLAGPARLATDDEGSRATTAPGAHSSSS